MQETKACRWYVNFPLTRRTVIALSCVYPIFSKECYIWCIDSAEGNKASDWCVHVYLWLNHRETDSSGESFMSSFLRRVILGQIKVVSLFEKEEFNRTGLNANRSQLMIQLCLWYVDTWEQVITKNSYLIAQCFDMHANIAKCDRIIAWDLYLFDE